MALDTMPAFDKTKKKLKYLWDIASQLVGQYNAFDDRLTTLEKRVQSILNSFSNNKPS